MHCGGYLPSILLRQNQHTFNTKRQKIAVIGPECCEDSCEAIYTSKSYKACDLMMY